MRLWTLGLIVCAVEIIALLVVQPATTNLELGNFYSEGSVLSSSLMIIATATAVALSIILMFTRLWPSPPQRYQQLTVIASVVAVFALATVPLAFAYLELGDVRDNVTDLGWWVWTVNATLPVPLFVSARMRGKSPRQA